MIKWLMTWIKNHWVEAMESELESMYSNKVWTLVKVPNVIKLLVVNGFTREMGLQEKEKGKCVRAFMNGW
jgi:hypothetical protein